MIYICAFIAIMMICIFVKLSELNNNMRSVSDMLDALAVIVARYSDMTEERWKKNDRP